MRTSVLSSFNLGNRPQANGVALVYTVRQAGGLPEMQEKLLRK